VVLAGAPADDLKTIQNKYYFRGRYAQSIDALQTYLARTDVTASHRRAGQEFLAASYILSGAPDKGRDLFARMLKEDPRYNGPAKSVFKEEIVSTFVGVRDEMAAVALRNAPEVTPTGRPAVEPAIDEAGKPIYKKWWFYGGILALLVVAGSLSSDEGEPDAPAHDTGTVSVGVRIQ
jgi:hypothetical protein